MASSLLKRLTTGWVPLIPLVLVLLVSLLMMGDATENSVRFGRMYSALLVINGVGLVALLVLIGINLYQLVHQYRRGVAGSRLTVRMVLIFVCLSVAPVLVVYYFSLQFLQRGIDSWFDVRVEHALDDSLELSRLSLDLHMREVLHQAEQMAGELSDTPKAAIPLKLDDLRARSGASEVSLLAPNGRVIASSDADTTVLVPSRPSEGVLLQVHQSGTYVGLDPLANTGLHIRAVVKVDVADPTADARILQVLYSIPKDTDKLAASVQAAYSQYKELNFLRKPLRYSFTLTLSLVLLLSLLAAVLTALFSARRLAAPIRDLAEGTRAVAAGDYAKRVPLSSHDELGFLVQSFNTMTRRIARASAETQRSQQLLEKQNTYLEAVLGHLSSGVITLDEEQRVRRINRAAAHILGVSVADWSGRPLLEIETDDQGTVKFFATLGAHLHSGAPDWHEEVLLTGPGIRKVLMCRGTTLPGPEIGGGGYVIVFDDVTALVQAQRDAAWGEVARRLAHEIKNPLTPIQLSAERLRHKCLDKLDSQTAGTLDRYTHTIIQQVKTMKEMVNAFSDYARPPRLRLASVDLNGLIGEVLDLYRHGPSGVRFDVRLEAALPAVEADAGRLRQLLHNLLKNALEALAEQPSARVTVETHLVEYAGTRHVELRLCDNGPGFPAAVQGQIFEPYVTTKPRGTGLGLAIVKKIVEEHGGVIWSEAPPQGGACLVIRLPAAVAAPAPGGEASSADAGAKRSLKQVGE